jgi:hypothetical protein
VVNDEYSDAKENDDDDLTPVYDEKNYTDDVPIEPRYRSYVIFFSFNMFGNFLSQFQTLNIAKHIKHYKYSHIKLQQLLQCINAKTLHPGGTRTRHLLIQWLLRRPLHSTSRHHIFVEGRQSTYLCSSIFKSTQLLVCTK